MRKKSVWKHSVWPSPTLACTRVTLLTWALWFNFSGVFSAANYPDICWLNYLLKRGFRGRLVSDLGNVSGQKQGPRCFLRILGFLRSEVPALAWNNKKKTLSLTIFRIIVCSLLVFTAFQLHFTMIQVLAQWSERIAKKCQQSITLSLVWVQKKTLWALALFHHSEVVS